MNPFQSQAEKNEELLSILDANYPNAYDDWKITIIFYICLHYIKSKAFQKNINLGNDHKEMLFNISQKLNAKMPLNQDITESYFNLFEDSRYARYSGFSLSQSHLIELKNKLIFSRIRMAMIKKELIT